MIDDVPIFNSRAYPRAGLNCTRLSKSWLKLQLFANNAVAVSAVVRLRPTAYSRWHSNTCTDERGMRSSSSVLILLVGG